MRSRRVIVPSAVVILVLVTVIQSIAGQDSKTLCQKDDKNCASANSTSTTTEASLSSSTTETPTTIKDVVPVAPKDADANRTSFGRAVNMTELLQDLNLDDIDMSSLSSSSNTTGKVEASTTQPRDETTTEVVTLSPRVASTDAATTTTTTPASDMGVVVGNMCMDAGETYGIGEKWSRGCDESCECATGGQVMCHPRCSRPMFRRGSNSDAACSERATEDSCCSLLICTHDAEFDAVEGDLTEKDLCSHKGQKYHKGDTIREGCDEVCTCGASAQVTCKPRCAASNKTVNDHCVSVADPDDACCTVVLCDVTLGDHEAGKSPDEAPHQPLLNLLTARVVNGSSVRLELAEDEPKNFTIESSEDQETWRREENKGLFVMGLKTGKAVYLRVNSGAVTSNAVEVFIPMPSLGGPSDGCSYKGRNYSVGEEFHDGCKAFCVCADSGIQCADIECPTDFGLDVLDPHCVSWENVPKDFVASPPRCCPEQVRCKNNGSCTYQGQPFDNWAEIPIAVTGCEKRCYCEFGNVTCQPACPPVPATPPSSLACRPQEAMLGHLPDDDCCRYWLCPEKKEAGSETDVQRHGPNHTSPHDASPSSAPPPPDRPTPDRKGPGPFLGPFSPDHDRTPPVPAEHRPVPGPSPGPATPEPDMLPGPFRETEMLPGPIREINVIPGVLDADSAPPEGMLDMPEEPHMLPGPFRDTEMLPGPIREIEMIPGLAKEPMGKNATRSGSEDGPHMIPGPFRETERLPGPIREIELVPGLNTENGEKSGPKPGAAGMSDGPSMLPGPFRETEKLPGPISVIEMIPEVKKTAPKMPEHEEPIRMHAFDDESEVSKYPGPIPLENFPKDEFPETSMAVDFMEHPHVPVPKQPVEKPSRVPDGPMRGGVKPHAEVEDHEFPGESPGQPGVWVHPNQFHQQSEIPGKQNPELLNTQHPDLPGPVRPSHAHPGPNPPHKLPPGPPNRPGPEGVRRPDHPQGPVRPPWLDPNVRGHGPPPGSQEQGPPFQGPLRYPSDRPVHIHIPNHPGQAHVGTDADGQVQDPHLQQILQHLEQTGVIKNRQQRPKPGATPDDGQGHRQGEGRPPHHYVIQQGHPGKDKPGGEGPTEEEIFAELQAQGIIPPHQQIPQRGPPNRPGVPPQQQIPHGFLPYPQNEPNHPERPGQKEQARPDFEIGGGPPRFPPNFPPHRGQGPPQRGPPQRGPPQRGPPGDGRFPHVKTEEELVAHLQQLGLIPANYNPHQDNLSQFPGPGPGPGPIHGNVQPPPDSRDKLQQQGLARPPAFPGHDAHPNDEVTVQTLEPVDEHTIRLVFSVPQVLVGLHGRVELRYTPELKNNDETTWDQHQLAPPGDLITTPQLEFELGGLQPDTMYKIRISVLLRDLNNSPSSPILTVRTPPASTPGTTLPPQIAVDSNLELGQVNATWALVKWRKFTDYELQFVDGVQLRYKELDGKVYAATPLIHRAVTSYTLEDLKPNTQYEVAIFFIPFPGQTTELQDERSIEVLTAEVQDLYKFNVELEVHHIKSQSVEISWTGVPYPEDKYVNIFRAIYQSESGKEDLSNFKVAKRDAQAVAMITDLKPGTRYHLWLEVYLTNGRIKKSNVQDFITKPGSISGNSQQGKLERAEPTLEASSYYGLFVTAAIFAAIALIAVVLLVIYVVKKKGQNTASISSTNSRGAQTAYDNPSFKVDIQHETMNL